MVVLVKSGLKILLFAFAILSLASVAFAADYPESCKRTSSSRYGNPYNDYCLAQGARTVSDCSLIENSIYARDCYENFAATVSDCNEIPIAYRKTCVVVQTYQKNPSDMQTCRTSAYTQDCYIYYVKTNSPRTLGACDEVPDQYVQECYRQVMHQILPMDEKYCGTIDPKYYGICVNEVDQNKQFLMVAAGLTGLFGALCLSPILCPAACILIIVVTAIVAAVFYTKRKKQQRK
ncbi:Uncharacterised protein [Candidatus Anstonella stagnisolia]|nr:Uncharacterised protein [Candidatus Anstonella stagnisolia]